MQLNYILERLILWSKWDCFTDVVHRSVIGIRCLESESVKNNSDSF